MIEGKGETKAMAARGVGTGWAWGRGYSSVCFPK